MISLMAHAILLFYCASLFLLSLEHTQAFSSSYRRKITRNTRIPRCWSSKDAVDTNNAAVPTKKVKGAKRILVPMEPKTLNQLGDGDETSFKKASRKKKASKSDGTTKKKAIRKAKKKDEISHWLDHSDPLEIKYENSNSTQGISLLRFKIRGNPRPLRRHRTSFGRMYNPSEGLQNSFRDNVRKLIFSDDALKEPLFDGDESLVMTIIFRLKRPKKDFVGGKPASDRMRPNAPSQTAQTRTDVDNLVKFVFDSMNTILYEDDRQIMSVHVIKVLDNEGMCQGSTEVLLQSVTEEDVGALMSNSFAIVKQRSSS
ncbi:unnamed protein product [Cylindrotheca closterium]|uniref:Uncharacterized protein n=1 Tax=Cylindrotheca closterium TaxID=2856 RepID=A0AAD2CEP6_9STRA|nr:unnamed protein product [Cylindrotheca closterium]